MKEKILYSSAIIPDNLYIKRDADRKLKEIILRMSKPAYISVARQMGKTNLLIQTKRELENDTTRVVYIDITNKFETAQECFRYIVNQILNSNEEIVEFIEANDIIKNNRLTSKSNPTEEYQNEIKEILKKFRGNLVIFLDEVDDLRKHTFSDDIFGQVRKTYFIRETYPVLKRITYVLSGVIDPEKLIKTKENSPFNIAIPIYLEDFSLGEFYDLINKSEIVLDNEVKEYIYDWIKGNPRMSFEILSLIEDEYINENEITNELVDRVIRDFYLTNFKNPPIDHIRDLIRHNTEIRKALIKLKNGLSYELSDDIINKLYLYGIIASKINKENLTIKNKVIELSLSDEWLENIELEKKGYFNYGKEKIIQKEYFEGIRYLKEYLENDPKGNYSNFAKFYIGEAYYMVNDHNMSNQYLLEKPIEIKHSSYYYSQIFYTGVNYLRLNDNDKSISCFSEIIDNYDFPDLIMPSKLNICEINLLKHKTNNFNAHVLYLNALDYLNEHINEIVDKDYYYTIIYYRLGYIFQPDKDKKQLSLDYFYKAIEYSKPEDKPIIYLYIDSYFEKDIERRKCIYLIICKLIIDEKIEFSKIENKITPFNDYHLKLILSNLFEFNLITEFNYLFEYSLESIYKKSIKNSELYFKIGVFSINNNSLIPGEELIKKVFEYENVDYKTLKQSNQILGLLYHNRKDYPKSIKYFLSYIELFESEDIVKLELNDFNSFISIIEYYRSIKEFDKSFECASIIEKYFDENLDSDCLASCIFILFYIMDYYAYIGKVEQSKKYGNKILSEISNVRRLVNDLSNDFSYVDKKMLDNIEEQTKIALKKFTQIKPIEPLRINREPGRNEFITVKYKDGKEIITKYKKVINDINIGECMIVK